MRNLICLFLTFLSIYATAQTSLEKEINDYALKIEADLIRWRRHLHANPELSNREYNTMEYIYKELSALKLPMEKGAARTGVIALLDTGKPGPVIGLRADIDGLPVKERVKLEFAAKAETEFEGKKVGVMHACGHDAHTAILMATANVLTRMKDQLTGKIVFVFQPAEEGAPVGEEGGAALLIKEGLIKKYGIEVMFGLHMAAGLDAGMFQYKTGGTMAASDRLEIKVNGKQTHGSRPWGGVDPIVTSAQIIMGLQTIVSRQIDLTKEAAVITIGQINGGVRNNIIPEDLIMIGTIRTLDANMQKSIHDKIKTTVTHIAESAGATAEVTITPGYPITVNDAGLTNRMLSSLEKVVGENNVRVTVASTGAEDFAFYAKEVPSFFFFLGGKDPNVSPLDAAPHHTPEFCLDESGFLLGVKAFCNLVVDYGNLRP
ncbi:MAG: amidohydrolase [Saprospiraceae bacterium]|nr:amidohydrolase [Saprospiraceae bacterium]